MAKKRAIRGICSESLRRTSPVTLRRRESVCDRKETQPADQANPEEYEMSINQEAQDNMKYQRWLAESLVANLDYEKAVKISSEMC
jgi:hypothetical protein